MHPHFSGRLTALTLLAGAAGCASTMAKPEDRTAARPRVDTVGVIRDTTQHTPPGYKGMERDTARVDSTRFKADSTRADTARN